jgi:hypothetical protein
MSRPSSHNGTVLLVNQYALLYTCTGQMPLNSPRILVLRAHLLEMIISVTAMGLGLFMWLSMSRSNSGINLLAGAVLFVGGLVVLAFALKSVLKFKLQ